MNTNASISVVIKHTSSGICNNLQAQELSLPGLATVPHQHLPCNIALGLQGLINAYEHGCSSKYEIAEYLRVTERELTDCITAYRNKFGVCTEYNGYIVYFIPHLAIVYTNNFNCEFTNELIILNLFDLVADRKLSAV